MEKREFQVTESLVKAILGNAKTVNSEGIVPSVLILNVNKTFTNEDGETEEFRFEPREGEDEGQPYAIANLRLLTEFNMNEAFELFENGELQEALNKTMSIRLTGEQMETFTKGMYVDVQVIEVYSENVGEDILVASKLLEPKKAKTVTNKFAKLRSVEKEEDNGGETPKNPAKPASKGKARV